MIFRIMRPIEFDCSNTECSFLSVKYYSNLTRLDCCSEVAELADYIVQTVDDDSVAWLRKQSDNNLRDCEKSSKEPIRGKQG